MHRRHDDAVAQLDAADGEWRKQQQIAHGQPFGGLRKLPIAAF
jgi:hypothetical protein